MHFQIIVSQPGYLPETDPYSVEELDGAIDCLVSEIDRSKAGSWLLGEEARVRKEAREALEAAGEYGYAAAEYVHEVRVQIGTEETNRVIRSLPI